jgi:hypothetical protein
VAQVIEHLLSKCEALNLNPSAGKKKKIEQKKNKVFLKKIKTSVS